MFKESKTVIVPLVLVNCVVVGGPGKRQGTGWDLGLR